VKIGSSGESRVTQEIPSSRIFFPVLDRAIVTLLVDGRGVHRTERRKRLSVRLHARQKRRASSAGTPVSLPLKLITNSALTLTGFHPRSLTQCDPARVLDIERLRQGLAVLPLASHRHVIEPLPER